jgi:hypothetical protein
MTHDGSGYLIPCMCVAVCWVSEFSLFLIPQLVISMKELIPRLLNLCTFPTVLDCCAALFTAELFCAKGLQFQ